MADEVSVRFSGDTTKLAAAIADARAGVGSLSSSATQAAEGVGTLNAQLDQARASSQGLSEDIRNLAQTTEALVDIAGSAVARLRDLVVIAAGAVYIVKELGEGAVDVTEALGSAAVSAYEFGDSLTNSAVQGAAKDIVDYADAATYGAGATRSLVNEQTGLSSEIGRTIVIARTWVETLRLAWSGAAATELAGISAANGLATFTRAAAETGRSTDDVLNGFTAKLMQIPGMTTDAAMSIETMLGSLPNYSVATNAALVDLIATISATGDAAEINAKKIAAAFVDQNAGGGILGNMVASLAAMRDIETEAAHLATTLQPTQASGFYDAIIAKLKGQYDAQKAANDAAAVSLQNQGFLSSLLNMGAKGQLDLAVQKNIELKKSIDLLNDQKSIYDQMNAVKTRDDTFRSTLDEAKPVDTQIGEVNDKIGVLQGQLNAGARPLSAEDITTLVRTVIGEAGNQSAQGQLAVAAVALNRLANGNFGESLDKILKAGNGSQFNTWRPMDHGGSAGDQANAPTPIDSYAFQKTLHDIVLPLITKQVDDPTNGALNFYNPDLTPPKNQFTMDNSVKIGDHLFGTAKGSPAPVAPMDPDDVEKTNEALGEQRDKLQRLQDLKAGGSALDKANLETAEQTATATRDDVAAQQRIVEAKAQQLAQTGQMVNEEGKVVGTSDGQASAAAQTKAAESYYQAVSELRQKEADAAVAASKVEASAVEKNSFDEVAVLNQALAQKLALETQGSVQYAAILTEMTANTRRAVEKQAADAKSAEDLKASAYREGTQRRMQILNAELTQEQSQWAVGSAKWNDLERQKQENLRKYLDQQASDTAETENAKYDATLRRYKEEQDLIREEARSKGLSSAEEYQQLAASLARQATAERAHFAALTTLYADNPQQYRKYALQLAEVDARVDQERLAAQRAYAQQINETYKQTFEQIGSSLSSSIMGMIQGTTTLRGAMQNVAREILQMWLQSNIRMLADYAAKNAAEIALHVAGEATKTGATASGEAARAGLVETGSVIEMAQVGAGVIKSIMASASETFAGVFGFLSPIMGPAAVGPAAAAEATVAAKAALPAFATGSWALPSSMVAQVHAGEMIVPAGATPWAQSLMAAAAGGNSGGGANGGIVLHHTSYGRRTKQEVMAESASIVSAIHDDMRTNPMKWRKELQRL